MMGWPVFLTSLFVIAYVILLYPALLALRVRLSSRSFRPSRIQPTITVIIAVYNGERFLKAKLKSVLASNYPRELLQILVVSDGSTDRTDEIAREFEGQGVVLIRIPRGGKCAALNAAQQYATGEILVLTDVRQQLDPEGIQFLADCFSDPEVGVASGDLRIRSGTSRAESDIGLYWRFESWMRRQLSAIDSIFGATGPFYAIRRSLFVPLPEDTLLDDMYLPLAAFFRGFRLVVESRAIAYDYPTSLETEFRRKVRTLAGNYQILLAYPQLLGPSNRMWIHFVSYKLGRLLLPAALVALAVSSFFLPSGIRAVALLLQFGGYALALLDPVVPNGALKRLSSPARTFATMMIATVCGLSVFFVPARKLWRVTGASPDRPGS